jgi:peptidyl-prolyl isomerase E (cyclophilin E)
VDFVFNLYKVEEKVLHSAFIPFGDITDINIPLDYETGK